MEVGCGLGAFTNYLLTALPGIQIVGMDISKTAIEKARKSYPAIQFIVGDMNEIDKIMRGIISM